MNPFWPQKCWHDIQEVDGQGSQWSTFRLLLMNNILVGSLDLASHHHHLCQVQLQKFGLVLNIGCSSVGLLGHCLFAACAQPLTSQVEAVKNFLHPCTIKEMQGLVNFYCLQQQQTTFSHWEPLGTSLRSWTIPTWLTGPLARNSFNFHPNSPLPVQGDNLPFGQITNHWLMIALQS